MAKKKTINIPALIKKNQARWDAAKFSPRWLKLAEKVAARLCAPKAKAIYKQLQDVTGVPWFVIAVIHEREASQSWAANIAQGDRWDHVSVHVPKGRGPFRDFKAAAIDALTNCHPYAAKWKDWSEGGTLTILQLYNGVGSELYHNLPSGYIWSGTDQYTHGKYVADNQWSETEVDEQIGCATLLKQMMALDPDVTFGRHPAEVAPEPQRPEKEELDIDPDTYPDGPPLPRSDPRDNEPPAPTYEDGPPPASKPYEPPAPTSESGSTISVIKDAVGSKIGTKTVATGTAIGTGTVAAADDSWFAFFGRLLHSPRFWIILVIVLAFGAYLLYNCVQNYKAKRANP